VAAGESFYFLMNNKGIKNTLAVFIFSRTVKLLTSS